MTKRRPRRPRTVASIAALGRACGVHRNTAGRWVARGCPRRPDGTFDLAAVASWHAGYIARVMDRADTEEPGGIDVGRTGSAAIARREADARYRRIRAALAALELEERRAALFPAAEIAELLRARRALWGDRMQAFVQRAARRIAGVSDPNEVELILRDEVDVVLRAVTSAAQPNEPSGGTSPSDNL